MFKWLNNIIRSIITQKASKHRAVDIVEVRTKQLGLLSVKTETLIRITNSFFLPIHLVSIDTKLTNEEGIVVGKMKYSDSRKIKGKTAIVIATHSEISIISSIFHAINNLLSQPIYMRSVGIAVIKVLWWEISLAVDDEFNIMPHQLKILSDETEEEKQLRRERHLKYKEERDQRIAERKAKYSERKEERLKRKHGDGYIPKEIRAQEIISDEMGQEIPIIVDEDVKIEWTKDDNVVSAYPVEVQTGNMESAENLGTTTSNEANL
jgi:hypothetical protein